MTPEQQAQQDAMMRHMLDEINENNLPVLAKELRRRAQRLLDFAAGLDGNFEVLVPAASVEQKLNIWKPEPEKKETT